MGIHTLAAQPEAVSCIRQLYHSTWTAREGVPAGILRIAQSTDGFLWLATSSGVYRFDGVQFLKFRPADGGRLLSDNLVTLYAPRTGGLWVGYQFGGVSFIKDGRITNYAAEGIFRSSASGFLELEDGTLWTATGLGMARFVHGHWQTMGPEWGYQGRGAFRPFLDASGTLWASNGKTLQYLPPGEHRFHQTTIEGKLWALLADRPDRTWLASERDLVELMRAKDGSWSLHPAHMAFSPDLAAQARDGSFWMGSDQSGIYRLAAPLPAPGAPVYPALFDNFTAKDGLTDNLSLQVIRDREGSMWVATEKGLDQFRPAALSPISMPEGTNGIAIAEDHEGLLVGVKNIRGPSLFRLKGARLVPVPHSPEDITSLYADDHTGAWIGVTGQLWRMTGGHFTKIPMPGGASSLPLEIQAMTVDAHGMLWISILGHGTFTLDTRHAGSHAWAHFNAPDREHLAVLSMLRDHQGRIWQGFVGNNVAVITDGKVQTLGARDGVTAGDILAIAEHGDHIWLGGTAGLSYYRNGVLHALLASGDQPIQGVNGIVETADHGLWLNQPSGVLSVSHEELAQAFADPRHRVRARLYTYLDGLTGAPVQLRPLPTAIATRDGRLYFADRHVLAWIDPAHIALNNIAPTVVVDQVLADGRAYLAPSTVTLQNGVKDLRFDYTAPSLLIPERVRFRYMLEGFDEGWQDAGTRRQAFYAKVPPGHYTFRVIASNNDGLWSPASAAMQFYLPPTFLESWYFTALILMAAAALLSLLYKLRLRHATNQVRSRLLERLRERERIAQDLHDTFFQSIQLLFLRFHTVTKQLPREYPARRAYEQALEQSEQVMMEGRELLIELRSEPSHGMPLHASLKQMVEDLRPSTTARITLHTEGSPRELDAAAGKEVRNIARESLANAIQHAGASSIQVLVCCGQAELRLVVSDDGRGIPAAILERGHRDGHLGLPGLRARARQLGARVEIRNAAAGGAVVELIVPAVSIYPKEPPPHSESPYAYLRALRED
jgi:signal transduction histidine kinase/ligand-binding sensor domain-containing protein